MDFTNFTELVRLEVSKKLDNSYTVRLDDIRKNNGIILRGLTITQGNCNISPTIYLNNQFTDYINGKSTFSDTVSYVLDTYNKNKIGQSVDMRYFLNYEEIKERVIYKLINTEKNKELLKDIPHIEFLDLSIVFQCLILQEEFGFSSILIHNVHIKLWDISVEKLYEATKENTPRLLPYQIKSMQQVLFEIMKKQNTKEYSSEDCIKHSTNNIPMFVLSNQHKVEGASCILYPNVLHDFADTINSNFYIIPSSIHEVLLLPTKTTEESASILSMIQEINDTQVSVEEILSYSLYFYDKRTDKVVKV